MSLSKPSTGDNGNKWKSYYDTARKFKAEWQRKYPWVEKAKDGSDDAHCSFCRQNITPRLSNLDKHEQTAKHKRQANLLSRNTKINLVPAKEDEGVKELELQLAVGVTCHSSIMAVDHLSEIMVQHGKGSKVEKMQLHRTKCSLLIKNVISPALHQDLCADIAGQKYCVILDESTDVSCTKLLCVVIRYYSKSEKKNCDLVPKPDTLSESNGQGFVRSAKELLGAIWPESDKLHWLCKRWGVCYGWGT